MGIRTSLLLLASLTAGVAITVTILATRTSGALGHAVRDGREAVALQRAATELRYTAFGYLASGSADATAARRALAENRRAVASASRRDRQERRELADMQLRLERIGLLLERIAALRARGRASPAGARQRMGAESVLRDELLVTSQRYVASGLRLTERSLAAIDSTSRRSAYVSAALVAMLVLLVSGTAVVAQRISRALSRLRAGIAVVGDGDLSFRQRNRTRDEIGDVARAFDEMTERLERSHGELLEATTQLEAFAYSVSHDLRAPLRAIDGFSRILLEEQTHRLDGDGLRYFGMIRDSTARMSDLIDGLLTLSRVGRAPLARRAVDPRALVTEAWRDARGENGDAELEIAALPACEADPALLRTVFQNLLENAVKFSSGRHPAHVEVGSVPANGGTAYFVRDDGVGFDMRHGENLFGAFQRLHAPGEFPGTGIGLATVKRIVTRHGGAVWAEAVPGAGATFFFTLEGGAP